MNTWFHTRVLPMGALLLGLGACSSEAGGSSGDVRVQFGLLSTGNGTPGPSAQGRDQDGSSIVLEEARAIVRDLELYLPAGSTCADFATSPFASNVRCHGGDDDDAKDDSGRGKIEITGPFLVDLIAGTSEPSLEAVAVPALNYGRVDVRFHDKHEGLLAKSDPLDGNTLHATGSLDVDGETTPLELLLKFSEDARFESASGKDVGGSSHEVLLWLDVSTWFSALPITECMEKGKLAVEGGTLRIDERGDCSDLENELKEAIKRSGRLGRRQ